MPEIATFICIASGPSLTRSDCGLAISSGHPIIAVNSSWQLVPECHHLFAADCAWWDKHHAALTTTATRWTASGRARLRYGIHLFRPPDNDTYNSGQRAIQLAAHLGAERIILLGYDCSLVEGAHWHGEHPAGLKNPDSTSLVRWQREFERLTVALQDTEIINCSRQTALALFPLVNLDERYLNADHFTDNYPVGAPIPWPNDTPPENYVLLQGQTFDITKYPKLAVAYSTGILPDLRGQTIKGKPEGREALSAEAGGVQSHTHTGAVGATDLGSPATDVFDYGNKGTDASGDHTHNWGGAMSKKGGSDQAVGSSLSADFATTSAAGNHAHTVAIGAHQHTVTLGAHGHDLTINPTGNAENTVDNIAFNYIVRLA